MKTVLRNLRVSKKRTEEEYASKHRKISMSEENEERLKENIFKLVMIQVKRKLQMRFLRKLFAGLFEAAFGEAEADEADNLSGFHLLHLQSIAIGGSQKLLCAVKEW